MDKLPDLKELTNEAKDALIEELWQKIQELEGQTQNKGQRPKKTAKNSSVPPSNGFKENIKPKEARGEKRQGSIGRTGGGRVLHPEPDQTVVAKLKSCPHCGKEVASAVQRLEGRYDKIELPSVKPYVTRVERYSVQCECCEQRFIAPVPVGMEAGSPFGKTVETMATYWRYSHAVSYQRLRLMFAEVFGLSISEGGLARLFERTKQQLDGQVEEILSRLQQSRLICSDETSARVNGQTQWEWVFQNDTVCLHVIRPSRGAQVIRQVLQTHRPQVWVSDLYSAQKTHPAHEWQVCLAHQLRDCQFAIDAGDDLFAPIIKQILLRAFVIHKRREHLAESTRYQYRCELYRRLQSALAIVPRHKDGIRLKKRFCDIQDHLFLFLEDATIPPTNNSSEQAIRMSTVFRKVTHGFRSDWGRDLFAAVRSVVNTGKRQGLSAFESIHRAISANASLFEPG